MNQLCVTFGRDEQKSLALKQAAVLVARAGLVLTLLFGLLSGALLLTGIWCDLVTGWR